MVFHKYTWIIISSKLDPETWYKTQLTSKDFHLDTKTLQKYHYKKASRPFAKKLLALAVDRYLDEFEFIILPFNLKKGKEILQMHTDLYIYGNGLCGPIGAIPIQPMGPRGKRCSYDMWIRM